MFGFAVQRGAVFHAQSKRRREVEFDAALRSLTEQAIADLHLLVDSSTVPPAIFKQPAKSARFSKCACHRQHAQRVVLIASAGSFLKFEVSNLKFQSLPHDIRPF